MVPADFAKEGVCMSSIKKQARVAGLLYLLVAIIAPIGIMYVPGKLIVRGDATATADNIRAFESLFRIGIASELVGAILMIFVVVALFWLFKGVNEKLAWQMLILGALISAPMSLLNGVNNLAALVLVGGPDFLSVFDQNELDALAYMFLRLHYLVIVVAQVFWGLWLFPFGMLVIRSGFIPRVLGYLLYIAGLGYLVDTTFALLLPQFMSTVSQITLVMNVGELPIVLWLLIWGAKEQPSQAPAS
jgi:hypothetical protein